MSRGAYQRDGLAVAPLGLGIVGDGDAEIEVAAYNIPRQIAHVPHADADVLLGIIGEDAVDGRGDDLLTGAQVGQEQQAKETAEAVLDQIDLLKKSILARAFRGELGTNDPNEESAVELLKEVIC